MNQEDILYGVISVGGMPVPYPMPENPYEGPYSVTPSQQIQILQALNKTCTQDITIEPIPECYGLITWNGFYLTVS